jgi:hypothetical protein
MKKGSFVFDRRLFAGLFVLFLFMYMVHVLTHEGGHYLAARAFGHRHAHIHYKYTDTGRNALLEEYRTLNKQRNAAYEKNIPFPQEDRYILVLKKMDSIWHASIVKKFGNEETIIVAAGQLETMLTGTIGVSLILLYRKRFLRQEKLIAPQWIIVFVALFWLDFVGSLIARIFHLLFVYDAADTNSDVFKVSLHFGWNPTAVIFIKGMLGVVALWITFIHIPVRQRCTLIIAAFTGGLAGYFLWEYIGPMLLP